MSHLPTPTMPPYSPDELASRLHHLLDLEKIAPEHRAQHLVRQLAAIKYTITDRTARRWLSEGTDDPMNVARLIAALGCAPADLAPPIDQPHICIESVITLGNDRWPGRFWLATEPGSPADDPIQPQLDALFGYIDPSNARHPWQVCGWRQIPPARRQQAYRVLHARIRNTPLPRRGMHAILLSDDPAMRAEWPPALTAAGIYCRALPFNEAATQVAPELWLIDGDQRPPTLPSDLIEDFDVPVMMLCAQTPALESQNVFHLKRDLRQAIETIARRFSINPEEPS